jgi:hypothetical protein
MKGDETNCSLYFNQPGQHATWDHAMTLEQLELKVVGLERELAELRSEVNTMRPFRSVEDTFGIFANDPCFDEIVRLGREYRDRVNAEEPQ